MTFLVHCQILHRSSREMMIGTFAPYSYKTLLKRVFGFGFGWGAWMVFDGRGIFDVGVDRYYNGCDGWESLRTFLELARERLGHRLKIDVVLGRNGTVGNKITE